MRPEPVSATTTHRNATRALNDLKAVLDAHAIVLPSLGVDALSSSGIHLRPLIDLGRVNLETARLLVRALSGAGPQ